MVYSNTFSANAFLSDSSHTASGSNAAATITLASGEYHNVLGGLYWSYSATPTNGNIKVQDGSTTVIDLDCTSAGVGFLPYMPAIRGTARTSLTVTLAAGGSGVVGKVDVIHWTMDKN